jgi:spore coat protein SA
VQDGDIDGVEVLPVDGRPDWLLRAAVRVPTGRRDWPRWTSRLHHPFHLLSGMRTLRRHGADVIQLTHEFANLLPARLIARRVPVITQIHAVWIDDQPALARRLRHVDAVATVSDFVRQTVVDVEPSLETRTATVRNGVDLAAFPGRDALVATDRDGPAAWRRRLQTNGRPLIVSVGRITPEKGTHVLAQATALLRERGHDFVVAVAGQKRARYQRPGRARNPRWREIERLNQNYLERVEALAEAQPFHLLDTISSSDLRRLLAAADLFVAPSFSPEPCGLPVLEAMAMDLPVVASADGAYPELVGDAAVLVPPGDPGALADVMESMLLRPGLRAELARRARPQASRHTWDATAEALTQLAERIC